MASPPVCRDANCSHERHCYACNRPIDKCNGFVLIRTMLEDWPQELPIWELCGLCVIAELMPILTRDY